MRSTAEYRGKTAVRGSEIALCDFLTAVPDFELTVPRGTVPKSCGSYRDLEFVNLSIDGRLCIQCLFIFIRRVCTIDRISKPIKNVTYFSERVFVTFHKSRYLGQK